MRCSPTWSRSSAPSTTSWGRSTGERAGRADPRGDGAVPAVAVGRAARATARAGALRLALAGGVPRGRRGARRDPPAYCVSVASFYDMYHLEPVGSTSSRCAPTSRARSSARSRSSRPSRASSASTPAARPRTGRSRCVSSSARAAAAGARSSRSTTATASRCGPRTCRASSPGCAGRAPDAA